jgi:hypothetical protein
VVETKVLDFSFYPKSVFKDRDVGICAQQKKMHAKVAFRAWLLSGEPTLKY